MPGRRSCASSLSIDNAGVFIVTSETSYCEIFLFFLLIVIPNLVERDENVFFAVLSVSGQKLVYVGLLQRRGFSDLTEV